MSPAALPLALTQGDPAGVGPEIVVKAWAALKREGPAFLAVGDHDALASASGSGAQAVDHDTIENRLYGQQLSMISRRYMRDLRTSATIETR